jgi:hypothetical protein
MMDDVRQQLLTTNARPEPSDTHPLGGTQALHAEMVALQLEL